MKVWTSKYRNHWVSPYTVVEYVFFWTAWSKCGRDRGIVEDKDFVDHPAWVEQVTVYLDPICRAWAKFLDIVHPRIEYIKLDRWDTWSMYNTLADIILPMLKQLSESKHGAPFVDDDDVPEEFRSTSAKKLTKKQKDNGEIDEFHFARWDWVLCEMIWAFSQVAGEGDWENKYYSGEHDITWVKKGNGHGEMVKGPNDTFKIDMAGLKQHEEHMKNGFRLFGKYYTALWD
jgi:hypothetical protein